MNWRTRPDGDLDLSVLTGFELAAGEGREVAIRLEHAVVQEQLDGQRPPEAVQLVMTAAAAEALAAELMAVVHRSRGDTPN